MTSTVSESQTKIPIDKIRITGQEVTGWNPMKLTITASTGAHDVYDMQVLVAEKDPARWLDEPISFRWGVRKTGVETFHGYVVDAAKGQSFQRQPTIRVHSLAPTWKLALGQPKYWTNRSTEQIVREIADKHRLGVVMDPHSYVWPQFAQTKESDWGVIVKLANALSYHVTAYNGVIHMVDPLQSIKTDGPVLTLRKSTNLLDTNAMLMDFNPTSSSAHDRSTSIPDWGYFATDGTVKRAYDSGEHYRTDLFIPDEARAKLAIESLKRNTDLWNHTATARVRGTSRIIVGSVVDIDTGLSPSVRDTNDGRWLVVGVQHEMSATSYQTSLKLVRDKVRLTTTQLVRPFWGRASKPGMVLSGGSWVSDHRGKVLT